MRIRALSIVATVSLLASTAFTAAAEPYLLYRQQGAASPLLRAWEQIDASSPLSEGSVEAEDAWFVYDDSGASGSRRSWRRVPDASLLALADTHGWTMRGEIRVVDAADARDYAIWMEFGTGVERWSMQLGSDADGNALVGLVGDSGVEEAMITGGSVYHLYELVYDPTARTVDLWVDGVERISDHPGLGSGAGGVRITFGSGCSSCTGRAHYRRFEFELDLPVGTPDGEALRGIDLVPPLVGEVDLLREAGPHSGRHVAAYGDRVAISDERGASIYRRDGGGVVLEQRVDARGHYRVTGVDLGAGVLTLDLLQRDRFGGVQTFGLDPTSGLWIERSNFGSNGRMASAVVGSSVYVAYSLFHSGPQGIGGRYYLYCERVDFENGAVVGSAQGRASDSRENGTYDIETIAGWGDQCLFRTPQTAKLYRLPLTGLQSGDHEWRPVLESGSIAEYGEVGRSLALRGNRLAVGAVRNDLGAVLLFDLEGGEWLSQQTLGGADPDFGRTLAIDGDRLVVGQGPAGGQVFLYERDSSGWGSAETLPRASGTPLLSSYGDDVAVTADRLYSAATAGGVAVFATSAADAPLVASHVRADLYVSEGGDPASAAFRYREGLFPNGIRSALVVESTAEGRQLVAADTSGDPIWGPAERRAAGEGECLARFALEQSPADADLGELLLDIHHDRLAADLVLASALRREADRVRLQPPDPGLPVIDQEIAALTDAFDAYLDALAGGPVDCARDGSTGYFHLLEDRVLTLGGPAVEEPAGTPAGFGIFRSRVPGRALMPASDERGDPIDGDAAPLFEGYKDLALVAGALRDIGELAEEIAGLHYKRASAGDVDLALAIIEDARTLLTVRGSQLIGLFGGTPDMGDDSAIPQTTAAYQASLTSLAKLWDEISNGTNPLGFDDDFLLVVNDPSSALFDSYDVFQDLLHSGDCPTTGTTSFLEIAACDFEDAQGSYDTYRLGLSELGQQFDLLNQDDALRLEEIGDESQVGSEIWQQNLSIEVAALRVKRNRIEISNLEAKIRFEVERRAEERRISDAMGKIRLEYADKQAAITEKIGEINAAQKAADSATKIFEAKTFWTGVAHAANGAVQAGAEVKKGQLEAEKEKLAALEAAEISALEGRLLDLESRTKIKTWLLGMNTLAVDSQEAAILLRQESGRFVQLLREKEFLEQRVASRQASFARRYYADPVFELGGATGGQPRVRAREGLAPRRRSRQGALLHAPDPGLRSAGDRRAREGRAAQPLRQATGCRLGSRRIRTPSGSSSPAITRRGGATAGRGTSTNSGGRSRRSCSTPATAIGRWRSKVRCSINRLPIAGRKRSKHSPGPTRASTRTPTRRACGSGSSTTSRSS